MSFLGGLDTRVDLLSCGSAGVLALELGSTNTGPVSSWLADIGEGRRLGMSTLLRELPGSSERNSLKWEELRDTFRPRPSVRSRPSAVNILWFLLVTVSGTGW